jgi:hypothetical protein
LEDTDGGAKMYAANRSSVLAGLLRITQEAAQSLEVGLAWRITSYALDLVPEHLDEAFSRDEQIEFEEIFEQCFLEIERRSRPAWPNPAELDERFAEAGWRRVL